MKMVQCKEGRKVKLLRNNCSFFFNTIFFNKKHFKVIGDDILRITGHKLANIGPQVVPRTFLYNLPRTSPKDPI